FGRRQGNHTSVRRKRGAYHKEFFVRVSQFFMCQELAGSNVEYGHVISPKRHYLCPVGREFAACTKPEVFAEMCSFIEFGEGVNAAGPKRVPPLIESNDILLRIIIDAISEATGIFQIELL